MKRKILEEFLLKLIFKRHKLATGVIKTEFTIRDYQAMTIHPLNSVCVSLGVCAYE